jgi:hypothetical protein
VKWRPGFVAPRGEELAAVSRSLLPRHLARAPRDNPFPRFRARLEHDLEWLMRAGLDRFHAYSFANLRQYGACFELASSYLGWLAQNGAAGLEAPRLALGNIAETAKRLQFQLARSMSRGKVLDLTPIDAMGAQWTLAMGELQGRFA